MILKDLSITFHTTQIKSCVEFYCKYFEAVVAFDCGWYATIKLQSSGAPIFLSFMTPPNKTDKLYDKGVSLNLMVEDVDAIYALLKKTDIKIAQEIANYDWGGRSFDVYDPIGNILLIYSTIEFSEEYKKAIK